MVCIWNNNLWGDEGNPHEHHQKNLLWSRKRKGKHKLTQPRMKINTRAMSI